MHCSFTDALVKIAFRNEKINVHEHILTTLHFSKKMIIDKPLLVAQLINQLAQLLQGIIIGEAPTDGKKAISTDILVN